MKEREAWHAAVHGVAKLRHDLATKQFPFFALCWKNTDLLLFFETKHMLYSVKCF